MCRRTHSRSRGKLYLLKLMICFISYVTYTVYHIWYTKDDKLHMIYGIYYIISRIWYTIIFLDSPCIRVIPWASTSGPGPIHFCEYDCRKYDPYSLSVYPICTANISGTQKGWFSWNHWSIKILSRTLKKALMTEFVCLK